MNPLKSELDRFLERISLYESLNYQTRSHLVERKKEIEKHLNNFQNSRAPFIGTSLVLGDLTGHSDNGWKINYHSGFQNSVERNEMLESIDKLISRNGMNYLANSYEVLESFLFDITGQFFNSYPDYNHHLKNKNGPPDKKEFLRKYYRSKNNKELFKLIRKLNPEFEKSERFNNSGIDLQDWYFVISNVRHSIVHSLFKINLKMISLNPDQIEILNKKFTHIENRDCIELRMSFEESKKQINFIAEFGFLIFKCLSLIENLDWKVLRNMQE